MIVSTPDKALLKTLWDLVRHNGTFDPVPLAAWAAEVQDLEKAGIPVYEMDGDLNEWQAAVAKDAILLESMGFVQRVPEADAARLTFMGQLHAETLEYPEWAQLILERAKREAGAAQHC